MCTVDQSRGEVSLETPQDLKIYWVSSIDHLTNSVPKVQPHRSRAGRGQAARHHRSKAVTRTGDRRTVPMKLDLAV